MFANHQPIIGQYARANADNLARVCQFGILTARQELANVPHQFQACVAGRRHRDYLFAWKRRAWREVWDNREQTFSYLEHVWASDGTARERDIAMLEYVQSMHGFGMVKGGFVLQLAYGRAGCIDSHNLALFGRGKNEFRIPKAFKRAETRRAHLERYLEALEECGGTEYLWDNWCHHVASLYPKRYRDAEAVSALHVSALGLQP